MTKEIVLKTDASYKPDVGCGISYNAEIEWEGELIQYKNSKFTTQVQDSTHGELVAAVYGILKTLERVKDAADYTIQIGTDCEFVVKCLTERYPDQPPLIKTALSILDRFKNWNIYWIPRVKNSEADALARSELMRHE